ncbi:FMN-binding negative transcriptional regulator [Alteromonas sp. a30]|uniref:FMN-binding negative transcriptional regulator n=1 Tax=Alteromonas sp. a30 TaxID=2730917 RepID=UPI002282A2C9|nr:FMN-binding negative transcriptional regulator [Alteromonas sp. a30]MCY7294197.1 FMN-binding negative transcriptional regulator [Alteromonas sp. a30]
MFIPAPFSVEDNATIADFLKYNSFGLLVSIIDGRPFATPLPFYYLENTQHLECHLAKANPQWKSITEQEILITIQGAHDYISPTWYENKGVPTWNYQMLHLYGKATVITDEQRLAKMVGTLSQKYEAGRQVSESEKWDGKYNEKMLKAIVGLDIEITEIQCKFKLSQNKSETDQTRVIAELKNANSPRLAKEMEKQRNAN